MYDYMEFCYEGSAPYICKSTFDTSYIYPFVLFVLLNVNINSSILLISSISKAFVLFGGQQYQ